jgi:hypothetical protein
MEPAEMDIVKMLRELHDEKKRLDAVIANLEAHSGAKSAKPARKLRRGRKSMSRAERLEVSRRMTQYWENRRAQAAQLGGQTAAAAPETPDDSSYAAGDRGV